MTDTVVTPGKGTLTRLAAGSLMVGFPGTSVPAETREFIAAGVRSFILFAGNVGEPEQIRELVAELRTLAGVDALIAIDHEGGRVNRLRRAATPWPSPMAWSATGSLDLVREASRGSAAELSSLGINLNFAPVADILADHRNPSLGNRCFSDDPHLAADCVTAFVEGHHDASVGATAKHFPGHGGTAVDSHIDLPRIDHDAAALRRGDLIPFAAAVRAGVDCLMISHVWYPRFDREVTPATISPNVVRFAREELAYDGVVVTDCMEMGAIKTRMTTREAIPRAILAGCDLTIVSHRPDRQREAVEALAEAVRDGLLPAERLREANRRLDALRRRVRPGAAAIEPGAGPRLAEEIAHRAVTLLRDEERFLPLRPAVGESIGLVTFPLGAASQVEETHVPDPPLAEAIRRRRLSVVGVPAGPDAEIDPILSKLAAVNTVLVGTAFTAGHAYQAAVVKALLQAGKRVVVVALRDPFDLLSFPEAPCYLATYDETPLSADVAVAVILGEREPRGHLPVTLPGCYPRGHGLRTTV